MTELGSNQDEVTRNAANTEVACDGRLFYLYKALSGSRFTFLNSETKPNITPLNYSRGI